MQLPLRLGIVSDTHGRHVTCAAAVRRLAAIGIDRLVHLGDVGGADVLDTLAVGIPVELVPGNCDDPASLRRLASDRGFVMHDAAGRIEVGDRRVGFTHGHDARALAGLSQWAHVVFVGHSHRIADDSDGSTRIVNPGALFRASRYTAASVVISATDVAVSWIDVPRITPTTADAVVS